MTGPGPAVVPSCGRCGTELPPGRLRCPACQALVHAARLQQLAAEADLAERRGDVSGAAERWQTALTLLPGDAPQRAPIGARVERLARQLDATDGPAPAAARSRGLKGVWVGVVSVLLFLLGKLKFLLLGLTKAGTLFSMLAFFAVYWGAFGWPFALGLVLSIYIHEMGHVAALRHYGIPASAPMFIPGIGALVRLKAHPPTPAQDARVGLAGPVWGTGAALLALALYQLTGNDLFAGLAHVGAVINLFNLIPFWQLDGGRGIAALSGRQRWLLVLAVGAAWAIFREGMLLLIGLVLVVQAFRPAQGEDDWPALLEFILLIVALGWLSTVRTALPEPGA